MPQILLPGPVHTLPSRSYLTAFQLLQVLDLYQTVPVPVVPSVPRLGARDSVGCQCPASSATTASRGMSVRSLDMFLSFPVMGRVQQGKDARYDATCPKSPCPTRSVLHRDWGFGKAVEDDPRSGPIRLHGAYQPDPCRLDLVPVPDEVGRIPRKPGQVVDDDGVEGLSSDRASAISRWTPGTGVRGPAVSFILYSRTIMRPCSSVALRIPSSYAMTGCGSIMVGGRIVR